MQRIGVIADAHANLPATRAVLDALVSAECDVIVHAGDAVALGPHPDEVVSLLLERGVQCLMGNMTNGPPLACRSLRHRG